MLSLLVLMKVITIRKIWFKIFRFNYVKIFGMFLWKLNVSLLDETLFNLFIINLKDIISLSSNFLQLDEKYKFILFINIKNFIYV